MAQEMIQAVRQAEINAELIEKSAVSESNKIVQEAKNKAENLIVSVTNEAQEKAAKAYGQAKIDGEKILSEALESVEGEIESLKKNAQEREQKAIDAILADLI